MEEENQVQYCPECGHQNPRSARFCMDCGHTLTAQEGAPARQAPRADVAPARSDSGTDWAGIVAAVLAFLTMRNMSRKARQTTGVIVFFVLFFGCPMACGLVAFVVESIARLFGA